MNPHNTPGQPSRKHSSASMCCAPAPNAQTCVSRLRGAGSAHNLAACSNTDRADRAATLLIEACWHDLLRGFALRRRVCVYLATYGTLEESRRALTSLTLGIPARRTRCCERERAAGLQHIACSQLSVVQACRKNDKPRA
jgi:hypothetical protein